MEFKCDFFIFGYCGLLQYSCNIESVKFTQLSKKASFSGPHEKGKHNTDVERLFMRGVIIHVCPREIYKSFPNLLCLFINNCELKDIRSDDFKGLYHLDVLSLSENHLKFLPDDLFVNTKKLKEIDLSSNQIKSMSSKIFDVFPPEQLKCVDLRCNDGINVRFDTRDPTALQSLEQLKNAVDLCFPLSSSTKSQMAPLAVLNNFTYLWSHKKFADFAFVIKATELRAHKCVLASQSPKLASMFTDDEQVKESNKIEIKDCSVEDVEDFLRLLYTRELRTHKNALEVLSLIKIFDVKNLEEICNQNVTKENALKALSVGNLYKSKVLTDAAFEEVKKILVEEVQSETLKSNPEAVQELLDIIKRCKQATK